jgi:hypothetical protein
MNSVHFSCLLSVFFFDLSDSLLIVVGEYNINLKTQTRRSTRLRITIYGIDRHILHIDAVVTFRTFVTSRDRNPGLGEKQKITGKPFSTEQLSRTTFAVVVAGRRVRFRTLSTRFSFSLFFFFPPRPLIGLRVYLRVLEVLPAETEKALFPRAEVWRPSAAHAHQRATQHPFPRHYHPQRPASLPSTP